MGGIPGDPKTQRQLLPSFFYRMAGMPGSWDFRHVQYIFRYRIYIN